MSIAASFEIEYLQYMDPTGKLVGNELPALIVLSAAVIVSDARVIARFAETKVIE